MVHLLIFMSKGSLINMIRIAIEKGVPVIDAYNMATINVARYYNIDHLHGNIATGRVANINFLTSIEQSNTYFCSCKREMGKT